MTERIRIDHGSLEAGMTQIQKWKVPAIVKREMFRFIRDLSIGKVNRGKRLSPERQLKYVHALRVSLQFFNKPTDRLTLRDVERFERALESGDVCSLLTGQPYAHSTKAGMRMLLRIFLRWRLGVSKSSSLTGWLDTRLRQKTPAFLKESEVKQLYKHCRVAKERFLIAVLFDSGARAEEFHNIRFEDIELLEGKSNFVQITLKEEYSKTNGRTISLYWKYSLEAVRDYLAQRVAQGIKPAEPVFKGKYSATRKMLQRFGHRVLDRPVHYHLLRHSSATFYANKLNRQELCFRYGWRFSSNMPDVYISRAGMVTPELDEKFTQTELSTLKDDLSRVNQDNQIKAQRIEELQASLQTVQRDMATVAEILALKPSAREVEHALAGKRRSASNRKD